MNNNVRFSQKEAVEIYKKYGFNLIDEYISNRTYHLCSDEKGYFYKLRLDNLYYGYKHLLWGKNNRENLEHNVNVFLKETPVKYHSHKVVENKKGTMVLVSLVCSCGQIFTVPLIKLVNNRYKNIMCNDCKKKFFPSGIKKNREEYLKLFLDLGYKIENAPQVMKPSTKVDLIDKFGFRGASSYASCKMNKHFATFDIGSNRQNFVYNANLLLSQNGYNTKCLGFVDKTNLEFLCGCGKHYVLSCKQFRNNKFRCDSCTSRYSSLETKVMGFLEQHKISYIPQYKFIDCYDKLPLPFDFYLKDFNTLIEVDGEQHFVPLLGSYEDFVVRKKHDEIKNKYCLDKNIPLIRIPYTAFEKDENWKTYLSQFIKD